MIWELIETAPTDFSEILVCFKGQFKFVYFIAMANGKDTQQTGYAKPEFWTKIIQPNINQKG